MKYKVLEVQTYADGSTGDLLTTYDTEAEAVSHYHSVMAAAALSDLPCHAVGVIRSDLMLVESGKFEHTEGGE